MRSANAKCSAYVGTSLDGFIARADGRIDWLMEANQLMPKGEDCGYAAFMASVDALVIGRRTFDDVLAYPEWPYGEKRVVVMSRGLRALPANTPATVTLSAEAPDALVRRLSDEGLRHLYIDGGVTIQSFLVAGLIDEITITTVPWLIGAGRPLFGPLPADLRLEHVATRAFEFGFVQSTYRVTRSES